MVASPRARAMRSAALVSAALASGRAQHGFPVFEQLDEMCAGHWHNANYRALLASGDPVLGQLAAGSFIHARGGETGGEVLPRAHAGLSVLAEVQRAQEHALDRPLDVVIVAHTVVCQMVR